MRIVLDDYDPAWPERFGEVAAELRAALGDRALRVEHIGSTSVPGLAAKPVIDVQVSVADLEPFPPVREALTNLGYTWHDDCPDARKWLFSRAEPYRVNLHVRVAGEFSEQASLLLRDYLRASASARARYEATKRALAERDWPSVDAYADAKGDTIWALLREADCWSWTARREPAPAAPREPGHPGG